MSAALVSNKFLLNLLKISFHRGKNLYSVTDFNPQNIALKLL